MTVLSIALALQFVPAALAGAAILSCAWVSKERQLNQSSYVFAVVSTIFLPLNFVTGLFGANLLGLPFADATNGFWVLVGLCLLMSVGLLAVFRWLKWL